MQSPNIRRSFVRPSPADGTSGSAEDAAGTADIATHLVPAQLPLSEVAGCVLQAELAAGGMAVVYRAQQVSLHRPVAIKALRSDAMDQASNLDSFVREARTLSRMSHPNLPQVHDLHGEHGALFIIMELCDGIDLFDALSRVGRLPWPVALAVTLQIARALAYIHDRGVLHRDLKPANVMLTTTGCVKLLDFGVAWDPDNPRDVFATQTGLGTPGYISPEQQAGRPLDARSDQFGLGILLFQMLTGRKWAAASDEPKPVAEGTTGEVVAWPRGVARLVDRCLQPLPNARFESTQDVVRALERLLARATVDDEQVLLRDFLIRQELISGARAHALRQPTRRVGERLYHGWLASGAGRWGAIAVGLGCVLALGFVLGWIVGH